jgi:hypothetical protein
MLVNNQDNGRSFIPPLIAFERLETMDLKKNKSLSLKLISDPTNADSQTYERTIKFFNSGTPEEWLIFLADLKRVLVGQNITSGQGKYLMMRRMITGDTLAGINKEAAQLLHETSTNFEFAVKKVSTHVFSQRDLSYQNQFTREFSARVNELNGYLKQFPPCDQDQELTDEELLERLEFAVQHAWQKNMDLQGFDPVIHTPSEFVSFCERHESTEGNLNNSEVKKGMKSKTSLKNGLEISREILC